MRKSHSLFAVLGIAASFAANAGPLQQLKPAAPAMPRLAPAMRMPALAMPSLAAASALPGLSAAPCVGTVCVGGGGAGGGPLQQYWFKYNTTQWHKDVVKWAGDTRRQAFVFYIPAVQYDIWYSCGEGCNGPTADTARWVQALPQSSPTILNNVVTRTLGFVGGGIGPIPLPKRPGDQPPPQD